MIRTTAALLWTGRWATKSWSGSILLYGALGVSTYATIERLTLLEKAEMIHNDELIADDDWLTCLRICRPISLKYKSDLLYTFKVEKAINAVQWQNLMRQSGQSIPLPSEVFYDCMFRCQSHAQTNDGYVCSFDYRYDLQHGMIGVQEKKSP